MIPAAGRGVEDETRRRHRTRDGDAARLRRRADLATPDQRRERGKAHRDIRRFRFADQDRLSGSTRRRLATAPSIPTNGWSRRSSARSTISSSSPMCAARQALDDAGWKPTTREDQISTGVMIGSGIGGLDRHRRNRDRAEGAGAAPGVAVLHSRPPDQSRVGLRVDRARPEGARTTRWSRPARPARMLSAMRRDWWRSAMPKSWWRAARSRRSRASAWRGSSPAARCPQHSTTRRNAPRVPTTAIATAS